MIPGWMLWGTDLFRERSKPGVHASFQEPRGGSRLSPGLECRELCGILDGVCP